jgi:hypothetical protein
VKSENNSRAARCASDGRRFAQGQAPGYDARVERGMPPRAEAFDWNCPRHITPRYTLEEIEELIEPLRIRIEELEVELATRPKAD